MWTFDFGNLVNIANKAVNFGLNVTKGVAKTVIENSDFNWLSGGESDSFSLTSKHLNLNNIKETIHSALDSINNNQELLNNFEKAMEWAGREEIKELPNEVHKQITNIRKEIVSSGIFGKVVGGALDIAYEAGRKLGLGSIVEVVSKTINPDYVTNEINNSLKNIEKNFFEKIEEDQNYQ